ncbi:Hypothetical protein SMAX5B_016671 [Scophthalmus maximus]|uniref:Uncharacterized protein n=1 Tax=Scophthalmus maximus TaxID=52904 RepID=A0A2U9AVW1_SCOMX|nr:Hypothetical protein SMAX5B_016671 [Scophthalmus maximus]
MFLVVWTVEYRYFRQERANVEQVFGENLLHVFEGGAPPFTPAVLHREPEPAQEHLASPPSSSTGPRGSTSVQKVFTYEIVKNTLCREAFPVC